MSKGRKMHRWPDKGTLHPVGEKHTKKKKVAKKAKSGSYKIISNKYKEGK